jgi:hypothetical protein
MASDLSFVDMPPCDDTPLPGTRFHALDPTR